MNEFEYYYDEQNNIIYISREILELSRKLNIEIEGIPKIINNKNCYSIHYKDLKKIEEQANIKGIENNYRSIKWRKSSRYNNSNSRKRMEVYIKRASKICR